jgi:ribonuclease HI
MLSKTLTIYCDGGSRGNPGEASYGFVIYEENTNLYEEGKRIGIQTNNFAEYSAVINALRWIAVNKKNIKTISFFLDSKLVVEQLSGRWRVKSESLRSLYHTIKTLELSLGAKINYTHVRREENTAADRMVNLALDNLL